jgi:septal ring factor EnvC (AmiA/AmiB activator)
MVLCADSVHMQSQLSANPIRRVVTMLQMMQKQVTEEGESELQIFEKYMCYCLSSEKTLASSIDDAETKIPRLESEIEEGNAEKTQLTSDIASATKDKEAAQKSIAEATGMRKNEFDAFQKEDTENKANVEAMKKALVSLRSGVSSAFLQTASAVVLRQLAVSSDLPEWDRHAVTAFLSVKQGEDSDSDEDAPSSDEIIGIISQMHETYAKDIVESAAVEKKALGDFNSLVSAKTQEIEVLSKSIESKNARVGEIGVQLVNLAQDHEDTSKQLKDDQKFLADLKHGCDSKQAEWQHRTQTRNDELIALGDTIKILNDDAAKHLFKKTMATPSFLQLQVGTKEVLHDARQALKQSGHGPRDPRINMISMAMRGKKVSFGKILAMVDKMVDLLSKEQTDDEDKKQYCKDEFDKAEDEKKDFAEAISDHKTTIANAKDLVSTLSDDIAKIAKGIKVLDKAVAEATRQRQNQNSAYQEELGANNAAIEILDIAKTRLNKFYNPDAAALISTKHQHHHKGRIDPPATATAAVQEAFSFVQTSAGQGRVAPDAAPDTWAKDKSAKGPSASIINMLNTLIKDTKKQVAEMKAEEKDAQFEYEQFMKDSSEKHMSDSKALSVKESAKAEAEAGLQKRTKALKSSTAEAAANAEYLASLHKQCDWLLEHFKVRLDARTAEIASLRSAKAVLNGADYDSFLQVQQEPKVKHNLRRNSHIAIST